MSQIIKEAAPHEVYMLRNKRTGRMYSRRYGSSALVWSTIQGPASAKGQIPKSTRHEWERVTLTVTEES